MNILHTLTAYPPSTGGAQLHHHQLIKTLIKHHNVQILTYWDQNRTDWLLGTTLKANNNSTSYVFEGVNINKIGFLWDEKIKMLPYLLGYYGFMHWSINGLSSLILEKFKQMQDGIDLVHNVRIGREPLSFASYEFAKKKDIPFVLTPIHHPKWEGWPYNEYVNLYKLADLIIALTKKEKETLMRLGVKEEKIIITGIGPLLSPHKCKTDFKEKFNIKGAMILFLGQHFKYKGYREILKSAKMVWQQFPDTHFVFIGPRYKKAKKFFESFKNEKRIVSLGFVNLEEKTNAIASCDIFCLPSTQESFGGVYTEAWSFKKPVIGCNIPAVSEVIDDGLNGFLISQDPHEISDKIILLLDDEKLRENFGQSGYDKVNKKYSWDRLSTMTDSAYKNLVN